MIVVAAVLAGIAALVHVYIFVLESIRWTEPGTRAIFRTTEAAAATTRPLAFNQGFYNLFLAVVTAVGIVIMFGWSRPVGAALVFAGVGSMLAAALVLILSSRELARAALVQGLVPLLAVLLLAIGLAQA